MRPPRAVSRWWTCTTLSLLGVAEHTMLLMLALMKQFPATLTSHPGR